MNTTLCRRLIFIHIQETERKVQIKQFIGIFQICFQDRTDPFQTIEKSTPVDKQGFGALHGIQIMLQMSSESFYILCILYFVGLDKIQELFVTEHISGQDPGSLPEDIRDSYLVKMMDP